MYRSSLFLTTALMGTTIALIQPVVLAHSVSEVQSIAKAVTVEIKLKQSDRVGSGVIIHKKGDLYTLVTNRHVICGTSNCQRILESEAYNLGLFDGQKYQVQKSAIKFLGGELDLAIIQFRSSRNYNVAKVSASDLLKNNDKVYTAGFPFEKTGFRFGEGEAISVVNKRLTGDEGGYTIAYNALTLPGMSGGGVFNSNAQLVAIHGQGDRFKENTDIDSTYRVGSKIGLNRGIPIRWLVQNLAEVGINLRTGSSISDIRATRQQVPATADEHFISGFNKYVEPGDNVVAGKQQAIQEFSAAIRLNPKYQYAYFARAFTYAQLQKFQQSLSDFNQAILINPKFFGAYDNRATLKYENLNDIQGALTDYNQAISLNPKFFGTYNNRAILKEENLNDLQGALTDYNQAISLNPKFSEAYYNRASLKYIKLNDVQGALSDYNQAISLNPNYSEAHNNRASLKYIKLNDAQGALSDYNQAISLNPRSSKAYNNRAKLKYEKLNDAQGALNDYNQAISLNPKNAKAYSSRGDLKDDKLNDTQGALNDYNQAISLNPKNVEAYYNRALLKKNKLNDRAGAIKDYRQAAKLFRVLGQTQYLSLTIETLRQLGATE
jgi:tetratricopeptide (TPR) repeat protein